MQNAIKRTVLIASILLFLAPSRGWSQSILSFPRVEVFEDVFTAFAFSNPSSESVNVTLTAYTEAGELLSGAGITNPVSIQLPAAGQIARLASEYFGITPASRFRGWVQATGSGRNLGGTFLIGAFNGTVLAGTTATSAESHFVFPLVSQDGSARSEFSLVNPNAAAAAVTVAVYRADGSKRTERQISVRARAASRGTLAELIPDAGDFSDAASVEVRSDQAILGFQLLQNYRIPGLNVPDRHDAVAMNGPAAASGPTHIIPHFVTGGGFFSVVGVLNAHLGPQDVTLTAYKEDGTLFQGAGITNPRKISLASRQSYRAQAAEIFGWTGDSLETGWIKVESALGFAHSFVAYGNRVTPSLGLIPATSISQTRFSTGQLAEGSGSLTGLTLVNDGAREARIEISAIEPDGNAIGRQTLQLGPKRKVGRLLREFVPASLAQVGGWVYVQSSEPVFATILYGNDDGLTLTNVPPQSALQEFTVPAQKTAAISGRVLLPGNVPLPGIAVNLTGPVNAVRNSDRNGMFNFTKLPAGEYRVLPLQTGVTFVPGERTITLAAVNAAGIDFLGSGTETAPAPVLASLSPASTVVQSRALSLTVFGQNFTPRSRVLAGTRILETTFVSEAELRALMPADLLGRDGIQTIVVETSTPGGGRSAAQTLTIRAATANPLVLGTVDVGRFPAGVAIHLRRRLALVTNQSTDDVSLIDLAGIRSRHFIRVGRSPADGIAVDPQLEIAVVANVGNHNVSLIDLVGEEVVATIPVGQSPIGVAIHPVNHVAYVTNSQSADISVIDLRTRTVTGTIAAGERPSGIAVDIERDILIHTNRGRESTVTIRSLRTNQVLATIPSPQDARAVAVNGRRGVAVVVNANSNNVSVIDLDQRRVVQTISVGAGPTAAAIHPSTNVAVVTNSGVVNGILNLGATTTVSVINLDSLEVYATVPVGSAAFGVAIDESNSTAVVANFGSNDATLIQLPNPRPTVSAFSPNTFSPGGPPFTLTVRGSGFVPTSVVVINGIPLATRFVDSTTLEAIVTPDIVNRVLGLQLQGLFENVKAATNGGKFNADNAPILNVTVESPGPGGGGSPPPPPGQNTTLQVQNPVPVVTGASPLSVPVGRAFLLTVSGNNFNASTNILINGQSFGAQVATPTLATLALPATLSAGSYTVQASNPPPGGGTSQGSALFVITPPSNPVPVVTGLSPASVVAGSAPITLIVSGSGFGANSTVTFRGSAVSGTADANSITVTIPAALLTTAGSVSVVVTNPAPGGGSAGANFAIQAAPPVVSGFAPGSIDAGSPSVVLQITGRNFAAGMQVTANGVAAPTSVVSATQLSVSLGSAFLAIPGAVSLSLINPVGPALAVGTFTVGVPTPSLDGVTPASATAGSGDVGIAVSGARFLAGARVAANGAALPTVFVHAGSLQATLGAALLRTSGRISITVVNPPDRTSNAMDFQVLNPRPVVTSIDPASLREDAASRSLTVGGEGFQAGSTIVFSGSPLSTTFVSSNQLSASVPAGLRPGRYEVAVETPGPGGGRSGALVLTIQARPLNPVPIIESLEPTRFPANQRVQLSIRGAGFLPESVVLADGGGIETGFVSSQLIVGSATFSAGTHAITVRSPEPGGGVSNAVAVTAELPPPPVVSPVGLAVDPVSARLAVGATLQLRGILVDRSGNPMEDVTRFGAPSFTSSAATIASVSASGLITGLAAGSATITISWVGFSATVTVTVIAPALPPGVPPRTYTSNADFQEGILDSVNFTATADQLQLNTTASTFPVMWIANAGEDTISRIDTTNGKETARYRTWFPGNHLGNAYSGPAPSRTAVDADGNAYVANRHFDNRNISIVKILADSGVDRNSNGIIDTSSDLNNDGVISAAEMKSLSDTNSDAFPNSAELQDERVAWIVAIPGTSGGLGRSLCIDPGGNLWLGSYNQNRYYKISSQTGAVLAGPISTPGHTPYGCLVDNTGILWSASLSNNLGKLNTNTATFSGKFTHNGSNYGIALGNNRVYLATYSGNSNKPYIEFNPANNTFTSPAATTFGALGVAVDASGGIFAGNYQGGGVTKFSAAGSVTWTGPSQLGGVEVRGTIIDSNNDVWLIHRTENKISKFRGSDGAALGVFPVGNQPYTYSDATGLGFRASTTSTGTWTIIRDGATAGTRWGNVRWTQSVPAGASLDVRVRAADLQESLGLQQYQAALSGVSFDITGRFLQIQVRFSANASGQSPILFDMTVSPR